VKIFQKVLGGYFFCETPCMYIYRPCRPTSPGLAKDFARWQ